MELAPEQLWYEKETRSLEGVTISGTELSLNLMWLLHTDRVWSPALGKADIDELIFSRAKLPCLLSLADGIDAPEWTRNNECVTSLMRKMGFYSGSLRTRPDASSLRKRFPSSSRRRAASGRVQPILIYTKPALGSYKGQKQSCAKPKTVENHYWIGPLCAYAAEAKRRGKAEGGIVIEIDELSESVDHLWPKLDKATKSRRMNAIKIFGHGGEGGQQVGNSKVMLGVQYFEDDVTRPRELYEVGSRTMAGTVIHLFGCSIAKGHPAPTEAKQLAWFLGARLLPEGGKVIMFKDPVRLDSSGMKLLPFKDSNLFPCEIPPHPVAARQMVAAVITLSKNFIKRGIKAAE